VAGEAAILQDPRTRRVIMTNIAAARNRLQRAGDLPVVLDAACDAFEDVLAVLCEHQDPVDDMFITFVMAATCAANGRDAVLFAPSLPAQRLHGAPEVGKSPHGGSAADVVSELAALSELLVARLVQAVSWARGHDDRTACRDAARSAREIHSLLTGSGP
jgi:hypothetical protein